MIYAKLLNYLPHILIGLVALFVVYFIYNMGVKNTEYNLWKDAQTYIAKQEKKAEEVRKANQKIKTKIFERLPNLSDKQKSCLLSYDPIHHNCLK